MAAGIRPVLVLRGARCQVGYRRTLLPRSATFDLSTIQVLLINEAHNKFPSSAFLGRSAAISGWVQGGGVVAIHDRNVCRGTGGSALRAQEINGQVGVSEYSSLIALALSPSGPDSACTPVPGSAGIVFTLLAGSDINVETGGTLVTNGPYGIISDTSLDGGSSSDHGYSGFATLPAGAIAFLNNGTPGREVAFAYPFGAGWVYYSTIPLDFYLDGFRPVAFSTVYAPNMIAYVASLVGLPAPAAVPALSAWGLAMLAIVLMGCAALKLGPRPGRNRRRV